MTTQDRQSFNCSISRPWHFPASVCFFCPLFWCLIVAKGCPERVDQVCAVMNVNDTAYAYLVSDPSTCCIEAKVWTLPPDFPTRGTRIADSTFRGEKVAIWEVVLTGDGQKRDGPTWNGTTHVGTAFSYARNTTAGTSLSVHHYGHHPELPYYRFMVCRKLSFDF
jgi:hypothetical protein